MALRTNITSTHNKTKANQREQIAEIVEDYTKRIENIENIDDLSIENATVKQLLDPKFVGRTWADQYGFNMESYGISAVNVLLRKAGLDELSSGYYQDEAVPEWDIHDGVPPTERHWVSVNWHLDKALNYLKHKSLGQRIKAASAISFLKKFTKIYCDDNLSEKFYDKAMEHCQLKQKEKAARKQAADQEIQRLKNEMLTKCLEVKGINIQVGKAFLYPVNDEKNAKVYRIANYDVKKDKITVEQITPKSNGKFTRKNVNFDQETLLEISKKSIVYVSKADIQIQPKKPAKVEKPETKTKEHSHKSRK